MKQKHSQKNKAFTLIELLVVIAIIGLLSGVVYASLSTSKEKAQEAKVKASLREIVSQAEVAYSDTQGYSLVSAAVDPMVDALNDSGIADASFYNGVGGNEYWAVTAKMANDATENFSVSSGGVVKWDTANSAGPSTWSTAVSTCSSINKRLPTIEELKALYDAHAGSVVGFDLQYYWSGTEHITDPTRAYMLHLNIGSVANNTKASTFPYVRCVSNNLN